MLVELFERVQSFFERLGVYTQIPLTAEMVEVLVKVVTEVLCILSIATKEVKRRRASKCFFFAIFFIPLMLDQEYFSGSY